MKKIVLVPIEPIPERYSCDWLNWFTKQIGNDVRFQLTVINPDPLTKGITQGSFLDICGTNYYKALQLAEICKMVHTNQVDKDTVFLFLDAWFPGIEMLAYMRDALKIPFKITGCMHAGSYDPHDFLHKAGMHKWGHDLEISWMKIYDRIFVATEFHMLLLLSERICTDNVRVTGFPIFPVLNDRPKKKDQVIFPHRLDDEKNPVDFDDLADILRPEFPEWDFLKTKEVAKTKEEYYQVLAESKIAVSFADQETWGIAMQECLFAGCLIAVPDRLSYREMYHEDLRFTDFEGAVDKVREYMQSCTTISVGAGCRQVSQHIKNYSKLSAAGRQAIPNILNTINGL